ncbi:hypothetical protein ACTXT7_005331 [Hymenolepis weldensis]
MDPTLFFKIFVIVWKKFQSSISMKNERVWLRLGDIFPILCRDAGTVPRKKRTKKSGDFIELVQN